MADKLLNHVNPLGRPPKYKSADTLWAKFLEYTELMDSTPIQSGMRTSKKGDKDSKTSSVELKPHTWTLIGFQLYAGITDWTAFKKTKKYQTTEFLGVIHAIETSIVEHQISGANVGIYSANLVARINGISDKQEITGRDGRDLVDNRSYSEKVEALQNILEKLRKE